MFWLVETDRTHKKVANGTIYIYCIINHTSVQEQHFGIGPVIGEQKLLIIGKTTLRQ